MKKNTIQIIRGIMVNANVSIKNIIHVKKIILGILIHVFVRMENIEQVLWMIQRLCLMKL